MLIRRSLVLGAAASALSLPAAAQDKPTVLMVGFQG
jgi:hypothetical protein